MPDLLSQDPSTAQPQAAAPFVLKLRLAFAVAALAVVGFGVAASVTIDRLAEFAQAAATTDHRLSTFERVARAVAGTQSAARGYALDPSVRRLERWEAIVQQLDESIASLGAADAAAELAMLPSLASRLVDAQREAIAQRAAGHQEVAANLLSAQELVRLADEIEAALAATSARAQRAWAAKEAQPTAAKAQWLVLVAGALLLGLLGWALWLVRHYEGERRESDKRLAYKKAMVRSLTANMADGVVLASADLRVVDANDAALRLFATARANLVGQPLAQVFAPAENGADFGELLARHMAGTETFQVSGLATACLRPDGGRQPVRLSFNDLQVAGQRLVLCLLHDLGEIAAAAAAVEAGAQQLREITDTLPVLIAETDSAQRLVFHNRAFRDFLEVPAEADISGAPLAELLEDAGAHWTADLQQALAGTPARRECTLPDAEGNTHHFDVQLIPRRRADGGVLGCYVFATDVTALKRVDRMKSEFVSVVSHELRTPLTSIRGSLGLIAGGAAGALPPQATQLVTIARNNCDRLVRLVNDILDVEKMAAGKLSLRLQKQDLRPLARQALAAIEGFARQHGVQVVLDGPDVQALVRVDGDRLVQVLTNLLSNAVKYSPADGTVLLRLRQDAALVRMEVVDQGPGIPPEFQPHVFQRFSQADASDGRRPGGSGLGLHISRMLVEKMGGQIGFTSPPGAGATFWVELPAWQAAALPVEAEPLAPEPGDRPRILHLEDDPDIRKIVTELTRAHADCVPARTLAAARSWLQKFAFDVVLLDLDLGEQEESGWNLMRQLQAMPHRPAVIVYSANELSTDDCAQIEAALLKSQATEAELLQAIRRFLPSPSPAAQVALSAA